MTSLLKKHQLVLVSLLKIIAGSALLALSAHAKVMLPFSPVPVTGQTLVLSLIALAYGRRDAVLTVLAYLAEGLAGLPIFALLSGPAVFISPSAGYLYGMLPAAYIMGLCSDKGCLSSYAKTAGALLLGSIAVFTFGLAWLAFFVPANKVLALGLYPFLLGGLVKSGIVLLTLPILHRLKQ